MQNAHWEGKPREQQCRSETHDRLHPGKHSQGSRRRTKLAAGRLSHAPKRRFHIWPARGNRTHRPESVAAAQLLGPAGSKVSKNAKTSDVATARCYSLYLVPPAGPHSDHSSSGSH